MSWAAYIKIVVGTNLLVPTGRSGGLISRGPMRPTMLEPGAVARVDPGGMRDIIASLPDQISAALRSSAKAHFPVDGAQRIFLVGMGGSAIAGDWTVAEGGDELAGAVAHLKELRTKLRPESGVRSNRAKALAVRIKPTVPIIYAAPPFSAIARRWQTQLNENSKVLAFSSAFPEADNNELVGWMEDPRGRTHRPILVRDRDEVPEMRRQRES